MPRRGRNPGAQGRVGTRGEVESGLTPLISALKACLRKTENDLINYSFSVFKQTPTT